MMQAIPKYRLASVVSKHSKCALVILIACVAVVYKFDQYAGSSLLFVVEKKNYSTFFRHFSKYATHNAMLALRSLVIY